MVDWGSLAQATNQLGFGIADIFTKRNALKRQIESQEKMNKDNILMQEAINQANIRNSREINSLMRHDANNAISIKKRDLQNAGYSTANPDLSGSPIAQLSSPTLDAAHVESEFTPEMAEMYGGMYGSLADRLLSTGKLISDIQLQKAQARAANAGASGQEIDNDWKDALNSADYSSKLQAIENMKSAKVLTDEQANNASKQFEIMQAELDGLSADNAIKNYEVALHPFRYIKEMQHLDAIIGELQAKTANWNADTSNKRKEGEILDFRKRIESVAANFAEMGVNFNGSSIVDSILRLIASPRGSELGSSAVSFIRNSIHGTINSLPEVFEGNNPLKSLIPGYNLIHGAKTAYQFFSGNK